MTDAVRVSTPLRHRQVETRGVSVHVVDGGASNGSDVLLIHGWPEDWSVFEPVMQHLLGQTRVAALDLPGIGASEQPPPSGDKATLAEHVRDVVVGLGLRNVILAGHDVGGQIVYAYLRAFPLDLAHAVIMNVAIPGVDPWPAVVSNPHIWHFGFHAIPELPRVARVRASRGLLRVLLRRSCGAQGGLPPCP